MNCKSSRLLGRLLTSHKVGFGLLEDVVSFSQLGLDGPFKSLLTLAVLGQLVQGLLELATQPLDLAGLGLANGTQLAAELLDFGPGNTQMVHWKTLNYLKLSTPIVEESLML